MKLNTFKISTIYSYLKRVLKNQQPHKDEEYNNFLDDRHCIYLR